MAVSKFRINDQYRQFCNQLIEFPMTTSETIHKKTDDWYSRPQSDNLTSPGRRKHGPCQAIIKKAPPAKDNLLDRMAYTCSNG